jgi:hypothetical protein
VPQSTMALRQVKHVCRVLFMRADQSEGGAIMQTRSAQKANPNLVLRSGPEKPKRKVNKTWLRLVQGAILR